MSNGKVLEKVETKRIFRSDIKRRELISLGHIMGKVDILNIRRAKEISE